MSLSGKAEKLVQHCDSVLGQQIICLFAVCLVCRFCFRIELFVAVLFSWMRTKMIGLL